MFFPVNLIKKYSIDFKDDDDDENVLQRRAYDFIAEFRRLFLNIIL